MRSQRRRRPKVLQIISNKIGLPQGSWVCGKRSKRGHPQFAEQILMTSWLHRAKVATGVKKLLNGGSIASAWRNSYDRSKTSGRIKSISQGRCPKVQKKAYMQIFCNFSALLLISRFHLSPLLYRKWKKTVLTLHFFSFFYHTPSLPLRYLCARVMGYSSLHIFFGVERNRVGALLV